MGQLTQLVREIDEKKARAEEREHQARREANEKMYRAYKRKAQADIRELRRIFAGLELKASVFDYSYDDTIEIGRANLPRKIEFSIEGYWLTLERTAKVVDGVSHYKMRICTVRTSFCAEHKQLLLEWDGYNLAKIEPVNHRSLARKLAAAR